MPFLPNPFDFTTTMKPLDGYTNAQNDLLEQALALISEALVELVAPAPLVLLNSPVEVAADRLERDIADLVHDTFKR